MTNRPRKHTTRRERRMMNERATTQGTSATMAAEAPAASGTASAPAARPAQTPLRPARPAQPARTAIPRQEAPMSVSGLGRDMARTGVVLAIVGAVLAVVYFMLR